MALGMSSTRRAFFGKVFGGALAALGVKASPIRWDGMIPAGKLQNFVVTDITPDVDGCGSGLTLLKKGDVYTISGVYR